MSRIMITVGTTIIGISIVQLANGFLGTLVSMSAARAGFSPLVIGTILASYYGGYTLGAATVGSVLQRVGHIRLFAALAGLVAASVALLPVFTSAPAWLLIRFVGGFGCAGLFITAESWLNGTSTSQNRGAVFAIYMVAANAALGSGQFLLNLPFPGHFELFSLAAALFCLALVPVSLTRSAAPALPPSPRLRMKDLKRLAPVAFVGCAASGLASSAFYSLIPAFAQTQNIPASSVAAYIATAIFGGLVFQIPVGKLSDRFDRRIVAAGVASGLCVTALCLAVLPLGETVVFGFTFILGGFLTTIYPVCVAHANDRVEADKVVAVSGQLILINGIASLLGPIVGTSFLGAAGIEGVFIFMGAVGGVFAAFAVWRYASIAGAEQKERSFLLLNERMSQPITHVAGEEGD